jgi:hypothetical protein
MMIASAAAGREPDHNGSGASDKPPAAHGTPLDREQAFAVLDALVGKRVQVEFGGPAIAWAAGTLVGPGAPGGPEEGEECWRYYHLDTGTRRGVVIAGHEVARGVWDEYFRLGLAAEGDRYPNVWIFDAELPDGLEEAGWGDWCARRRAEAREA